MGSGCGSISLIVAYRNPESEVIGFEKNETHHKISVLNHKENNLKIADKLSELILNDLGQDKINKLDELNDFDYSPSS